MLDRRTAQSEGKISVSVKASSVFDADQKRFLVFLSNRMGLPNLMGEKLYKNRWENELFFKCIKGNLQIKLSYGTSLNAVITQIWIAVTIYLLVAILH
jgi:IS4 transposase